MKECTVITLIFVGKFIAAWGGIILFFYFVSLLIALVSYFTDIFKKKPNE